jgi:hypothetical protein
VLGLAEAAVRDLQLKVLVQRLKCPTVEDDILMPQPLYHVRHKGSLLLIRGQTHTLLDDGLAGVVLQVEQVPRILGLHCPSGTEVWALEVGHGLEVLLPHRVLLIVNQEESDHHVGGGGEAALTQRSESHVRHLLDDGVKLVADNGSRPRHRGVKGYLHPDIAHVQAMGLRGTTEVEGD